MSEIATGLWDDAARRRLVRLCERLTGDRHAAEDLAQETLLEAWRNAHKLHDPTGADHWLAAGVSEDAVSMRLSRGKVQLRRLLAPQLGGEDRRETRIWCAGCGRRKLVQRKEAEAISFHCPGCDVGSLSHHVDLTNPFFERLVDGAARPTTVLGRLAAWSRRYFAGGTGTGSCTACGEQVEIGLDPERPGLRAVCASCERSVSSSLRGLACGLPEVRALRRAHPRARLVLLGDVEHEGVPSTVVRCEALLAGARIDAVFARDNMRLLAVGS